MTSLPDTGAGKRVQTKKRKLTQIPPSNNTLLLTHIPTHLQDLHTVEERRRDSIERVGRADEENAREVDGNVEAGLGSVSVHPNQNRV